jgi:ABC-type nitrate/sulfonate/bicarbonate transport system permease component
MISNFITTALRNLFKHKAFSFINIFGLAIAIAAAILVTLLTVSSQYLKAATTNPVKNLLNDYPTNRLTDGRTTLHCRDPRTSDILHLTV